jgi:hypothetical protein
VSRKLSADKNIMNIIIGRMLNEGNIAESSKICNQFNYKSQDHIAILFMLEIAQGNNKQFDYSEVEIFLKIQNIHKMQKTMILIELAKMCQYAKVSFTSRL